MSIRPKRRLPRWPRIGPCRDPLRLWFLEFVEGGQIRRRYFADRNEARAALREMKPPRKRREGGA